MSLVDDAAIERIALGVLDRSLPKPEWSHQAHFALALWLLRHRPALTVPEAMRETISRYNEATSTPNTDAGGYHHTITLVSVRAARAHLAACDGLPLHEVLACLMTSRLGDKDWLLDYWSRETLFSVAARRGWVAPDLAPLPFD